MNPEIIKKIKDCKALQGVTVGDVLATQRFRENMAAYLTEQREARKAAIASYEDLKKKGLGKGYKLPSHVVDKFMDMSVNDFTLCYLHVLMGKSTRPHNERVYIKQLGQQAYNLTIMQYVVDEFPELSNLITPNTDA